MTETTSELIDYNETYNNSPINFKLFSARLFGKIDADCVLNDITQCGCSIHIPKGINVPIDIFSLLIMSPDDDKKLHTSTTAQIRWINTHSSANHNIAGIKFLDVESASREKINTLMQRYITDKNCKIKCCLLQK